MDIPEEFLLDPTFVDDEFISDVDDAAFFTELDEEEYEGTETEEEDYSDYSYTDEELY